jgi:hypothetical protein
MTRKNRRAAKGRMSQALIATVVGEIEEYGAGRRGQPLSWGALAAFAGFSIVALWRKEKIKNAFQRVKQQLRESATPPIKPRKTVDERVVRLEATIVELREIIRAYDEQWALYEYNVHSMGLEPEDLRRPLDCTWRTAHKARRKSGRRSRR